MSYVGLFNPFRLARCLMDVMKPQISKYHMSGIIPGGGLGKLQGIKEEEYFSRQNHKLFENMKKKSGNEKDFQGFDYDQHIEEGQNLRTCTCSVKHKNLIEEAYFLSDQCDCLKILKDKYDKDTNE